VTGDMLVTVAREFLQLRKSVPYVYGIVIVVWNVPCTSDNAYCGVASMAVIILHGDDDTFAFLCSSCCN
jgi:hypothetical protein